MLHRLSGAAIAALALAMPALAEDADEAPASPLITVTGLRSRSLTTITPEDARAVADRVAGAASIVDLADNEGRRNATLTDALRLAPGIFAAPRRGQEDLRLSVRGSGISRNGHAKGMLVIRDGVPLNAADGQFDPQSLDLTAGSYLSVLRGYSALGVGATTLGGAVTMESRTGRNNPGTLFEADGGSFGTWRFAGSAGVAGDTVDGFVSATLSESQGYRQQSATDALRVSGNVGLKISPGLETRLFAGHADVDAQWPNPLTRAQFEQDPRQASIGAINRDLDTDIVQTFVSSRTTFLSGVHKFIFAVGYDDRTKDHATPDFLLIQKNQSAVASLVWELQDEDNPVAAPLTVGVRGMNTNEQGDVFAYAGGINSPQAALPGALNEIRDRRARNLEIFGRGEVPIAPNLIASASLAAVWTDRRVSDVPGPGNAMGIVSQYDQSYHDLLPGAGLVWKPQRDMMVFANWSQSFEAPSFFDLGGNAPLQADRIPRLSAQRADTFELGTRGQSGPVRWDITLFHSRIAGEVLTIDAAGALNPPITNADRTTRTGLEAAIVLDLAGLLGGEPGTNTLSAKWDWLRARFDNDPVYGNNIVAGIPEHNALIELQLQPVDGLAIRPNLTIRSRTETDLLNTPGQAADGFVLAGLSMRYEIGKVAIWVDARNIGNRRYVSAVNVVNRSTATSGLFFPGDGRSVFGGITFRL